MDVLIVDDLSGSDQDAVDEFVKETDEVLEELLSTVVALLHGVSEEDGDGASEPALTDPEQRRRAEHLKWLLEMMQQSWWQNNRDLLEASIGQQVDESGATP